MNANGSRVNVKVWPRGLATAVAMTLVPLTLGGCPPVETLQQTELVGGGGAMSSVKTAGQAANLSGTGLTPAQLSAEQVAAQSANALGLALLRASSSEGGQPENRLLSPTGLWTALTAVSAGARGPTEAQLRTLLRLPANAPQTDLMGRLMAERLRGDGRQLSGATALWWQRGLSVAPTFTSSAAARLGLDTTHTSAPVTSSPGGGTLGPLDFAGNIDQALAAINAWAAAATGGRINPLLSPGSTTAQTRLVLAFAAVLKAPWKNAFSKAETFDGEFQIRPGQVQPVALMTRTDTLGISADADWRMVDIPLAGQDLSVTALVPQRHGELAAAEANLTAERFASLVVGLRPTKVRLGLPRLRLSDRLSVGQALSKLGAGDAFVTGRADFSGINGQRDLALGGVFNASEITLDETGIEAATAGAVVVVGRGLPTGEGPLEFIIDEPFVLVVRDRRSGAMLLLGRVVQPGGLAAR